MISVSLLWVSSKMLWVLLSHIYLTQNQYYDMPSSKVEALPSWKYGAVMAIFLNVGVLSSNRPVSKKSLLPIFAFYYKILSEV